MPSELVTTFGTGLLILRRLSLRLLDESSERRFALSYLHYHRSLSLAAAIRELPRGVLSAFFLLRLFVDCDFLIGFGCITVLSSRSVFLVYVLLHSLLHSLLHV